MLLEWYQTAFDGLTESYLDRHSHFYRYPASAYLEPFRIADGLWYVGDRQVCVHLIETSDGLILIDSGFFHTNHHLTENIRKIGFQPSDVRWILHTHEHFDHFGASSEFRSLYGTKTAMSAVGVEAVRSNPRSALMNWSNSVYQEIPVFDYALQDQEVFEFGGVRIRCLLTPGHSLGVMSFFFEVTENGERHLAGLFGGVGTAPMTAGYMKALDLPMDLSQRMLASIARLEKEPVSIHLGNHPENNHTLEKREQQILHGGNPFVDRGSWPMLLQSLREQTENIIVGNQKILSEYDCL